MPMNCMLGLCALTVATLGADTHSVERNDEELHLLRNLASDGERTFHPL